MIYTVYFNACTRLGNDRALILGKNVFEQLPIEYHQSNDVMVSIFDMSIKCNDLESAEFLFPRLKKVSFLMILLLINACAKIGDVSMCQWVISYLSPSAFDNFRIQCSLIDMWVNESN